jgi:starch phosphorylase
MSAEKTAPPSVVLKKLPSSGEAMTQDFERYQYYHLGRMQGCPSVYTYKALATSLAGAGGITCRWSS